MSHSKARHKKTKVDKKYSILDKNGVDVTPLSLSLSTRPTGSDAASNSIFELLNQLELSGTSQQDGTRLKVTAFSGSLMNSQQDSMTGSRYEDAEVALAITNELDIGILKAVPIKGADPMKIISLCLVETDTYSVLNIPSLTVSSEAIEESEIVKAQNAKYKELKNITPNNDNYVARATQTILNGTKSKEIQATGSKTANAETGVTSWAIYDAYQESNPEVLPRKEVINLESELKLTEPRAPSVVARSRESTNSKQSKSSVSELRSASGSTDILASRQSLMKKVEVAPKEIILLEKVVDPARLIISLILMERAIISNTYSKKIISYRNVIDQALAEESRVLGLQTSAKESHESLTDIVEDVNTPVPILKLLWIYRCELTTGRRVTYVSYNKLNEDILAVAYGQSQTNPDEYYLGLVLVWSAKNPEWPDRVYRLSSPATSVDFSRLNPAFLAIGLQDGSVMIYDIRQSIDQSILGGVEEKGKHHDPVWELKWVERESENSKGESLVSVSTDGRVAQWTIRKGLEYTDLILLKRVAKATKTISTATFIARQTGGLCFDFNPKDSNVYLVGTEDGHIHKCSSSYNEQYLISYSTHMGPVVKVKWSPFLSTVFLSCSSDWTVRLWLQDNEKEIFKFQSGKDTINDIAWSQHTSTIFGTVSANGRLDIWDLNYSALDPAINHSVLDRQLTAISFASLTPVVITGDDFGVVTVYKICKSGSSKTEEESGTGLVSLFHGDPLWKEKEAQCLLNKIH